MKRNVRLAVVALIAAVFPSTAAPLADAQESRPNILIFITDDQRATGDSYAVMPDTMRLFRSGGARFTRGFTTTPTCCPARASLFSGRYAHNTGVRMNTDGLALDLSRTIQAVLKGEGYQTALSGKYLNEVDAPPPHFDHYAKMSGQAGRTGSPGYYEVPFLMSGESSERPIEEYSTTFIGQKATEFLDAFEANDATPWFMYVAPLAPHQPYEPEPRYASAPIPPFVRSKAFMERDTSDKPPYVRKARRTAEWARSVRAKQLQMLMSVDDQVEAIFSKMAALGEEDTLAFFLSDNGFLWGEHGLVNKLVPYRHSIRVPLFMRWPGHVNPGERTDIAALIDVAPTVYDALGLSPYATDGRSLLSPTGRTRILIEQWFGVPDWSASWRPGSVYVEYEGGFREFYNLARDPQELTNLRGSRPNLSRILRRDMGCAGAACP